MPAELALERSRENLSEKPRGCARQNTDPDFAHCKQELVCNIRPATPITHAGRGLTQKFSSLVYSPLQGYALYKKIGSCSSLRTQAAEQVVDHIQQVLQDSPEAATTRADVSDSAQEVPQQVPRPGLAGNSKVDTV